MPVVGWFSMSPLPRLHHHDIMTIVGLFTYCQYVIYIYTYRSYVRNVVVEWSGRSVAVRVWVRAWVREWNFSLFFFSV